MLNIFVSTFTENHLFNTYIYLRNQFAVIEGLLGNYYANLIVAKAAINNGVKVVVSKYIIMSLILGIVVSLYLYFTGTNMTLLLLAFFVYAIMIFQAIFINLNLVWGDDKRNIKYILISQVILIVLLIIFTAIDCLNLFTILGILLVANLVYFEPKHLIIKLKKLKFRYSSLLLYSVVMSSVLIIIRSLIDKTTMDYGRIEFQLMFVTALLFFANIYITSLMSNRVVRIGFFEQYGSAIIKLFLLSTGLGCFIAWVFTYLNCVFERFVYGGDFLSNTLLWLLLPVMNLKNFYLRYIFEKENTLNLFWIFMIAIITVAFSQTSQRLDLSLLLFNLLQLFLLIRVSRA